MSRQARPSRRTTAEIAADTLRDLIQVEAQMGQLRDHLVRVTEQPDNPGCAHAAHTVAKSLSGQLTAVTDRTRDLAVNADQIVKSVS